MATLDQIKRHVSLTKMSIQSIGNLIRLVSEEEARTWKDGEDGWTILEVLCHLRDFDVIFQDRAEMMLAEANPVLPAFDHEAMAIDRRYNDQSMQDVWEDFVVHREGFRDFYKSLSHADWDRLGQHPERPRFSMVDSLMQVGLHDNVHIDQLTKILAYYLKR